MLKRSDFRRYAKSLNYARLYLVFSLFFLFRVNLRYPLLCPTIEIEREINLIESGVCCVVKIRQFHRAASFSWLLLKYDAVRSIYRCLLRSEMDDIIRVYYRIYYIVNAVTNVICTIMFARHTFYSVKVNSAIMVFNCSLHDTYEQHKYFFNCMLENNIFQR